MGPVSWGVMHAGSFAAPGPCVPCDNGLVGGWVVAGVGCGLLQVMAEQQKALVQQVIGRLTEMAFENCIAKPSSSLSSSEQVGGEGHTAHCYQPACLSSTEEEED